MLLLLVGMLEVLVVLVVFAKGIAPMDAGTDENRENRSVGEIILKLLKIIGLCTGINVNCVYW